MSTRIGILTGGGDCPGLNGVIRAVTLHARQTYGWEVVGIRNGYEGLYEEDYIDLNAQQVQHTLGRGGTMLGSSNRANPFAYPVKLPDGRVEIHDVSARCLANLGKLELHGLVVVGGDGTMAFGKKFIERGATRIVGVPKTIDNDLEATDYTVGFQTAVEVAVEAIGRLHTTAESHERIMIVEVMGRYAGWIALSAGAASGAHAILIPEIPFELEPVAATIAQRERRGSKFSIVVVAEGAAPKGGTVSVVGKAIGQAEKLGGIGDIVAKGLERLTGKEARTVVLGHLLRGGGPTAFDRLLGLRFGAAAVRALDEGESGVMVALDPPTVNYVPIAEATSRLKSVPLDCDTLLTARDMGISFGDAMPLPDDPASWGVPSTHWEEIGAEP